MKYIKKAVEVEAIQWLKNDPIAIGKVCSWIDSREFYINDDKDLIIKTLEGEHLASDGDYIIKGIKGEFYPCKPDIFELTYDKTPSNFYERMIVEQKNLMEKLTNLKAFKKSEKFKELDPMSQLLLDSQFNIMSAYLGVLSSRFFIIEDDLLKQHLKDGE